MFEVQKRPLSVELIRVSKHYGDFAAVDKISLAIEKGQFFSLLGPSGCGKTTTLRMIAGLERPDEGDVLIHGERVNDLPPYERDVSTVFQRLALFPHLTIAKNIAFGLQIQRKPRKIIEAKVREMLDLVRLPGLEKRYPEQLSGGQQQRVALARSLVLEPEVLLLDEPLAALDRKLRKEMQFELRRIQQAVGITFIYVTHDQKEALSMSDRMAVMNQGKVVQTGAPREIYERPQTKFVADFLGASNFLTGPVVKSESGLSLRTASGMLIDIADHHAGDSVSGQLRTLALRPEAIEVSAGSESPAGTTNCFAARVLGKVYLGDATELEVIVNGCEKLKVHVDGHQRPAEIAVGAKVVVYWDRTAGSLVADD